jgi:hypothetical protein
MDITALFDDADSAEHALVNLQGLGIYPTRYKIRALHIPDNNDNRGLFGGVTAGLPGVAGIGSNAGGAGFAFAGIAYGDTAFGGSEPPNREVRLLVTVDDAEAHRAQSALISNHGRRVQMAQ